MSSKKNLGSRLEALGHWFFYMTLRLFGLRGAYLLLWPVIFSYVACSAKIHRQTAPYFSRRFPEHGPWQRKADTFFNLMNFGRVLVDRAWLGTCTNAALKGNFIGYDALLQTLAQGKGLVLLTAHIGNWQTALANLETLPVKVHALMQYDMAAAAKHYFDLQKKARAFEIIDVDSPFGGMIEAAAALQKGEVVTIMGDRYLKGPASTVDFFGSAVRIPDAAYILAATTQAPVAIILAAKTGMKDYELKVWDIFTPVSQSREDRPAMLRDCCRRFTGILEKHLRKHPYQWYNFFDFWQQ